MEFDSPRGIAALGELAAGAAAADDAEGFCGRALTLMAASLHARTALVVQLGDGAGPRFSASWGEPVPPDLLRFAEAAARRGEPVEEIPVGQGTPVRVARPWTDGRGTSGAVALELPEFWNDQARAFLAGAVQILAGALASTRSREGGQAQGELLARRNIELEALRELAGRLHDLDSEDAMLQAGLELVLEKLDLQAGWIFWGESAMGRLHLAAHHGIAAEFVAQAKSSGVGACLCVDVFSTGRLKVARNTTDCPRMPGLVCGGAHASSHACVPLKFERGVLGVLNIANRPDEVFTPHELRFLETVSDHICLAVDKARSAQAEGRRIAEARALAERLATIGTLASSLAHEVRNPLNSINLQLVLLSRRFARLGDASRDELMPIVETARHEIERLNGLVEEFLTLSTIDRLRLRDGDPAEPVRGALALMAPVAQERRVELSSEFSESLPTLSLDRDKLEQVLINLMRNALEAMPDGGSLVVSTRGSDEAVVIRIADSGTGIDPDLDVFDFFTTTKRGGTGLGLPIARRIVEAHGGTLTYDSTPGQGTVFSITLPVT